MKRFLATLLCLVPILALAQTRSVSVDPTVKLVGVSTNLFAANSNLLNASIASSGATNALTSINGMTNQAQTIAVGASGSDVNVTVGSGTTTIQIPTASGSTRGAVSAADWTTFNSKVGPTRAVNVSSPLTGGGALSSDVTVSIPAAASGQSGYLTSSDWASFNSRQIGSAKLTNIAAVVNSVGALTNDGSGNHGYFDLSLLPSGGGSTSNYFEHTLASGVSVGASSVALDRVPKFNDSQGGSLAIDFGTTNCELRRVKTISTATVGFDRPLLWPHSANAKILHFVGDAHMSWFGAVGSGTIDSGVALIRGITEASQIQSGTANTYIDGDGNAYGTSFNIVALHDHHIKHLNIHALNGLSYSGIGTNEAILMACQGERYMCFFSNSVIYPVGGWLQPVQGSPSNTCVVFYGTNLASPLIQGKVYFIKQIPADNVSFQVGVSTNDGTLTLTDNGSGTNFVFTEVRSLTKSVMEDVTISGGGNVPNENGIWMALQQQSQWNKVRARDMQGTGITVDNSQQSMFWNTEVTGCRIGLDLHGSSYLWFFGLNIESFDIGVILGGGEGANTDDAFYGSHFEIGHNNACTVWQGTNSPPPVNLLVDSCYVLAGSGSHQVMFDMGTPFPPDESSGASASYHIRSTKFNVNNNNGVIGLRDNYRHWTIPAYTTTDTVAVASFNRVIDDFEVPQVPDNRGIETLYSGRATIGYNGRFWHVGDQWGIFPFMVLRSGIDKLSDLLQVQEGSTYVVATVTVTNVPVGSGTTNLVVNGDYRYWTNAQAAGTILVNPAGTNQAATSLFTQITAFPYANVLATMLSPSQIMLKGMLGSNLTVTTTGTWASVTFETNFGGFPRSIFQANGNLLISNASLVISSNAAANRVLGSMDASGIVGWVSSESIAKTNFDQVRVTNFLAVGDSASWPIPANFDGALDYMNKGSDLATSADGKAGYVSMWFKQGVTGVEKSIIGSSSVNNHLVAYINASDEFVVDGFNSAASRILRLKSFATYTDGNWHHVAASWNLAVGNASLFSDGTNSMNPIDVVNDTIDYTADDWTIGTRGDSFGKFTGCILEPAFGLQYINLTNSIGNFYTNGQPVSGGLDGTLFNGTAPLIYLRGWSGVNSGSGGDFTVNGTLSDSCPNPFPAPPKVTVASTNVNQTLVQLNLQTNHLGDALQVYKGGDVKVFSVNSNGSVTASSGNIRTNIALLDVVTNDFVINTRYTNENRRAMLAASVQLTAAAAGTATVSLLVEHGPTTITNRMTVSAGPLASLVTIEPLTLMIGPGSIYYLTNETSGVGASASVVAGTCSLTKW
jgi:hypothetical protein